MKVQYPSELNYFMPPEWYKHKGTWLSYPHNKETFFEKLDEVRDAYIEIIYHISRSETVHINVNDAEVEKDIFIRLKKRELGVNNLIIHFFPTNDAWCRDHGAIFIKHKEENKIAAVCWKFNSWSGKYPYELDEQIPFKMAEYLKIPKFEPNIVLEGGSIDTNGEGLLLTTEQCLLNPNRNPHLSKKDIESYLKKYLGVQKILWLEEGIVGDDTDGHIDDIARFVNSNTIVAVTEEDPDDENYKILNENLKRLKTFTDLNNNPLNIIELPMPDPLFYKNDRLPASYANFYITNNSVLVPTFNCKKDIIALETLKKLFPHKEIIGIDCTSIIIGLGSIHCLTQQIPDH